MPRRAKIGRRSGEPRPRRTSTPVDAAEAAAIVAEASTPIVAPPLGESPTPMERAEMFAIRFRANANSLAVAYGGPLYLVGSMLTSCEPGDCDLRLMLEREDLELWFGKDWDAHGLDWPRAKWSIEREQLKQSRRLSRRWRGYPVTRFDFQFCCVLFSDDGEPIGRDRPKLRLDTCSPDMFRAGRGDP